MTEKKAHLSLKLSVETHKKLKVLSALEEKSITDLITEWVDQQTPDVSGLFGPKKKRLKRRRSEVVKADKTEMQKKVSAYRAEGMNANEIAEKLNADNVPTLSGKGEWNKNMVRKQFKTDDQTS